MSAEHRFPAPMAKVTWLLLGSEWQEVRSGTLRYEREDPDCATEWVSFEPEDDYTGARMVCRISAVAGYQVQP
jgi:hypothetical protein